MINWKRWVLEWLPFSMRTSRLYVFCLLMILPIRTLYTSFYNWSRKMRNRAGGTPQVCMLKKVIFDELGISIEIEEGNGKPYDFIIITAFSDVDKERQLFALLNRYKLAGKSYGYANAEVLLNYEWGGYVCEAQTLFVEWSDYVCEIRPIVNNYIWARIYNSRIYVKLDYPPTSNIRVVYAIYRDNGNNGIELVCSADFNILKGETKELSMNWNGSTDTSIIDVQKYIYKDDYYRYWTAWGTR